MHRQLRLRLVRRLFPWIEHGAGRSPARRTASPVFRSRLRLESLEDRRLLSLASGGGPGAAPGGGGCPVLWDTVIHDSDGDLFAFDLASGASGGPLVHLGQTIDTDPDPDEVVVLDDMAYSPLEDVYYGVTWTSDYGTSLLYRITIDTCATPPTVTTQRVKIAGNDGYLWADAAWPDGNEVNVNALEFTNDGTRLFAAGRYDSSVDYDWTFELDISTLTATKHVALQADGRDYHSAGDLEFNASGDMFVTTNDDYFNQRGELLKIANPLSAGPTAERVGLTGYTDIYGLTYDPFNRLVGYLSTSHESPPVPHRRSAQTIDEGNGDAQHLRWLIYEDDVNQVYLDDIYGAATTLQLPWPPITVTPTAGLVTDESGATAQFTVGLNYVPTANVTIGLASSDVTEGTVSPSSLTFTPANWQTPQTVTTLPRARCRRPV